MSADMRRMAEAFNTSVVALEDELMQLILDGQIQARIDSHNKVPSDIPDIPDIPSRCRLPSSINGTGWLWFAGAVRQGRRPAQFHVRKVAEPRREVQAPDAPAGAARRRTAQSDPRQSQQFAALVHRPHLSPPAPIVRSQSREGERERE